MGRSNLVGRTLAHYRINSVLGAGGMGEVYRATDTKLGRDVALKVLPAEMAGDADRLARFQREARAVAALNHPNVVTLYSVEEAENVHFITMELIEGQPLDRLIASDGLPLDRIVEIASALAEALAAAHEKGILHRDLKPANVMVTNEGRVKVLDFGLAKDVGAKSSSDATLTSAGHTQAGIVMGTPAYMSPEQVAGRALDHRTDIFSLGVLLHEMATGQRPFEGSSSAELISSILRDTPPSVTDLRPELPSDLARIIRRCLEKDPRHRMQTARDVSNEFRDLARQTSQKIAQATTSATHTASTTRTAAVSDSGGARTEEGFWVAVLPFKYAGNNADLASLADAFADEIITGLSKFSYLRVISRSSTSRYAGQAVDVRRAGKELNARYVMEGTLRQAGGKLRLAVQLVDSISAAHLWAENYERAFSPEAVFEIQDDLVPRIVSTVADMNGALPRSMSEVVRSKAPEQLSPYEAVLRSFAYFQRYTPEELSASRSGLEAAVRKAPAYADAWAMLSYLCAQDYIHGYELQADALATAISAARRAVELGPSNHLAYFSLAQSLWCQKDFDSLPDAGERCIALNPMDGNSVAQLGEYLTYIGSAERGMQLAERAKQLNPNHPGSYWFADFYHAFSQSDYRGALAFALKAKLRGNPLAPMFVAAACGQLGDAEGGAKAVSELVKFRPELPALMRKQVAKVWNPEYGERFLDGLRKAGMEIPAAGVAASQRSSTNFTSSALRTGATPDSGAARADEGFWVAVLPFKCAGDNRDLKALAEGLSEEIITGLSRFSYLRVIARGSTAKYSSESGDVRAIGKELGARYVMEGSLRQAGNKLRLAVQLVDAVSGAHLWAENYERTFSPESVFELQDELVPRIVSTVADAYGVLPYSMSDVVRSMALDQLTPYEALLRGIGYGYRVTPEEHAVARSCMERAVQQAPGYADGWAMLSLLYAEEYGLGFNAQPDPLGRALQAARRATDAAASNALAQTALARILFFRKEFQAMRSTAEQAMLLNPMDGAALAQLGSVLAYSGDWERGCDLLQRAMQLNPRHPGWYRFPLAWNAYRKGDYRGALNIALKINLPGFYATHELLAMVYGQLGERDAASQALSEMLKLMPNFGKIARAVKSMWFTPEMVELVLDGLRKAGLEIEDEAGTSAAMKKPEAGAAVREDEGFWVAVLPFRGPGGDADLEALADGLTEDVTTGLSRFPYLQVIAHNSAMAYKGRAADIRTVGRELGARYVIEGSIRKRGSAIRVSAQLMDAVTGTQLWAETYDREIIDHPSSDRQSSDGQSSAAGTFKLQAFEVQDDLTDHIVTTVADGYGVLVRSMAAPTRDRKVEELSASELVLRHYAFNQQVDPQEHAVLRAGLERALEREPNHATAWACLSNLYQLEYFDRFNPREKPLERAREAAWRAVKIDPACQMGWTQLAAVQFFSRDFAAFRETAERAMSLNPRDGTTLAWMGIMIAFSGEWERGMALTQRAMELNRHHPGWYHNVAFQHHYRKGEYEAALQAAKRINMPEFHWMHLMTAASCGMLGRHEEARTAIESLRKYNPTFLDLANVREDFGLWDPDENDVERLLQGLQKAGLKYGSADSAAVADSVATDSTGIKIENKLKSDATTTASGASRAAVREEEGFWVAVLPFKYAGASAELKALADGLSEEVVTGLSRFSYLRVIARGSTAKHSSESGDVRAIGKELGARYVMEGTLRQAGSKLRLAVQLVDATSGAHLWAENYERSFTPEAVFEIQDDLVPRIVSTVADMNGALSRSMSAAVRGGDPAQLTPYEAVLRSFGYFERVTPEDLAAAQAGLEAAVRKAPAYGDAWAMLALLHVQDYAQGFGLQADALVNGTKAARQAVAATPSNHLAHFSLAQALFFQKEFPSFRNAAERAVELNPMDGNSLALLAEFFTYSGDAERGLALADRAKQLNPNHPGWYWHVNFNDAYRRGDYRGALSLILKSNMTENWGRHALMAAAYGQLGEREAASKALQELRRLRPDIGKTIQREAVKWFDAEHGAHLMEGLRKAGLEIADKAGTSVAVKAADSGVVRAALREDEGFWVAVLPFKYAGDNRDLKALAEGLTEEVITGLSRFPYLRVVARGSTTKYSSESGDVRAVGKELGARYVMEGSLRQVGVTLRIAVQLVDAATGAHLWAKTYERTFRAEDVFAVQDDISDRVVATVADANGVLVRSIAAGVEEKPEATLTALDWMLRCFSYRRSVTPGAHARLREGLERFLEREPKHADVWACLALVYLDEFTFGFNVRPDALGRTLAAARRSVKIDRTCQGGNLMLANVHFFRRDIAAFRTAAEETIALNPRNTEALAQLAMLFVFIREFERGADLARHAMDLNPHHAGWYHVALVWDHFQKGEYQQALDEETRINIPGLFWQPLAVAACCGLLGRQAAAAAAAEELRRLDNDIERHLWRHIEIFNYASGFMDRILEGLAKAGLHVIEPSAAQEVSEETGQRSHRLETPAALSLQTASSGTIPGPTPSGDVRTNEGFWVAVLPFEYIGSNADLSALARGLTDETITGLSRFSYLRVIARGSTAKYSSESGDVRKIGKELGARYVMEGSLRQAGSKLRLAVQLADTVSGAHLWAETYERSFTPESVFEVQDDLVPRIVATVADQYGVLPRSMSEVLRNKSADALTPHEAVLRTFSYFSHITPEEHATVRAILERAVGEAPDHADSWAMLSMMYRGEFAQGYNAGPNPLDRALAAAQRAVELAPTHALGHYALATVCFFRKEMTPFRVEAERALALNPLDASAKAYLGLLIASSGEWERGCEMVEAAMQLNPNCPGYFYFARCWDSYRQGKYEEVLEAVARINMPNYFHVPAIRAAALGQLGRHDEADKALQDLLALCPDFAAIARREYAKWYSAEETEPIIDGLRKAGLKIDDK